MKKAFSVILSILFGINLLFIVAIYNVNKNLSYTDIFWLLSDNGLIGKTEKIEDGLYRGNKKLSRCNSSNDEMIHSLIQQYAGDYDIDEAVVQKIFEDKEIKAFTDKYIKEIAEYMVGASDSFDMDSDEVKKIISKGMDIYEEQTGEKYNRQDAEEVFEKEISSVKENVITKLDEAKTELNTDTKLNDSIKLLQKLFKLLSKETAFILCGIELLIILLLVLLWKKDNVKFLYIAIPGLIDSLILIFTFITYTLNKAKIFEVIKSSLTNPGNIFLMINGWFVCLLSCGLTIGVVSILLIVEAKIIKGKKS